jgi:(p)ppGpp synthase/HD superfamily hydrolase
MTPQPAIAMQAAELAHSGFYRRDRKTPYINHPAAVARRLASKGADDITIAAAWLHDVLEDTDMTRPMLEAHGVSAEVLDVVATLTRGEEDAYTDYLARVKANPRARVIKVADMLHNLSDDPTDKQVIKYAKGLLALVE